MGLQPARLAGIHGSACRPTVHSAGHFLAERQPLRDLQVFAVEARYEVGPFPLPAEREVLLNSLEALLLRCEQAVVSQA